MNVWQSLIFKALCLYHLQKRKKAALHYILKALSIGGIMPVILLMAAALYSRELIELLRQCQKTKRLMALA
ncbi:MAG: hypothetical protein EBR02_03050 [Alphaproteobacteria bacterium]|nr:hypothetical protein [Alphaproteobacteria bacterium]